MTVYIAAATHLLKLWFERVRGRKETRRMTAMRRTSDRKQVWQVL